jgi:thioredoxin reductase/NAD-dependent dihydropyrimidine dehydrogenase PreA subunit
MAVKELWAKKTPEPSYPVLPWVGDANESNVPGIYLVGEVSGTPLIKLGLNQGVEIAEKLKKELGASNPDPTILDVLIVGGGSSGLGAAMRAHELDMKYVLIEGEKIAQIVINMYKGKLLFAEPAAVPNKSSFWFEECTREELLERWNKQVKEAGLRIQEHEKVTDVQRQGEIFFVKSTKGEYKARRVILALGKAGNPRKAGAPGETENGAKIMHVLSDPSQFQGKKIFVYGGGDVAAEATLALCEKNEVTMVTIDKALTFPKKRNVDALMARKAEGKLQLHLDTKLVRIEKDVVVFKTGDGQEHSVPNDLVFEMIGAELPLAFFKKVGIKLDGTWDLRKWLTLAGVFLFVYSLYALKKFPDLPYSWPFNPLLGTQSNPGRVFAVIEAMFKVCFLPFRWMFTDQAYETMLKTHWFQQGYLYSLLYTVVMCVFGFRAFKRWSKVARDNRYQKWRYISLASFQVGFFLIANVIAVQAMAIDNAWRAWGLYQPWPLFFGTFDFKWWNQSDPRAVEYLFIGAGLFGTFVAIPLAARWHGKRFCTWICGCGGLAETLGDRWRHLSAKGKRSRKWEFQGAVVLVAAAIVMLVTLGALGGDSDNAWMTGYKYVVDFWLVAVIPVALYPFFGGKVWCRYWCPLAAWNQILARAYGRLQIKSNDKCISCTMCSKYCQVGVDVMSFAKNQAAFDNANSSCIQCGICVDVCPMGVLEFDLKGRKLNVISDAPAKAH